MKFMDYVKKKIEGTRLNCKRPTKKKLLEDFAPTLGCHPNHLISIAYEKRRPSYELARKICVATGGEVTIAELMEITIEKKYMCPCCHHKISREDHDKILAGEPKELAPNADIKIS